MPDTTWLRGLQEVKVLFPEDPNVEGTVTEGIWVLPLVGNDVEGTGIILNTSVSGEDRFRLGDLATWISPSSSTQKAEIVASRRLPWRTANEAPEAELRAAAVEFHEKNQALRLEKVRNMHVFRCDRCGQPGIGRLLPDDVWRAIIPPEYHKKTLCDSCIDYYVTAHEQSPERLPKRRFSLFGRRT